MVLPAPVGPTIAMVWPGSATQRERLDERAVGVVRERDVAELDPARAPAGGVGVAGGSGLCSSASRNSITRSNDAMPDWNTFIIDASWVSGIENVARVLDERLDVADGDRAARDPQAADHRDDHVLHVAHEHRERLHQARHELRAERRLVELVVGVAEPLLDLRWRPNAFTTA